MANQLIYSVFKVDHPELYMAQNVSLSPPNGIPVALQEDVFRYAKENMALVNVYIKDPVVTRIKRDQKIPIIGFVANTGGLLGLCMGFSLISAFEIIFHFLISIKKVYLYLYGYITRSFEAVGKYRNYNGSNTVPQSSFANTPVSLNGERVELNSVTSVVTKKMDDFPLVIIPHQCNREGTDKQNIEIKLQNSIYKSGLITDQQRPKDHEDRCQVFSSFNRDNCRETERNENETTSTSSANRVTEETTSSLPIKNIQTFLPLKPKRNEMCNRTAKPKNLHSNKVQNSSTKSIYTDYTKYIEVVHNRNGDTTENNKGCKEISPRNINIVFPPKAHSETSSVDSSRETLAVVQSIKSQNDNLSFHYDIENFSHIDETDNEEDYL